MSAIVIETQHLTKKYGPFTALEDLDLTVMQGEVFGLLGPNGAGKTTTILMLLGLTEPTEGTVGVLGFNPARQPLSVKSRVGYLPEQLGFYDELTAWENLIYIAKLNGLSRSTAHQRIERVLDRVGLSDNANQPVATFSRGMRQRLSLADVLVMHPQLIIMDEPTQGLDPERAREFLEMIRDLKEEGITILLSSHLLHQVQTICDRVGLFHRGQMVLEGTVPELAQRVLGGAYRIYVQADDLGGQFVNTLHGLAGAVNVSHLDGNEYEVEARDDLRPAVARAVVESGGKLLKLDVEAQSLDDIYTRYFQEVEHVPASQ